MSARSDSGAARSGARAAKNDTHTDSTAYRITPAHEHTRAHRPPRSYYTSVPTGCSADVTSRDPAILVELVARGNRATRRQAVRALGALLSRGLPK